MSHPLDGCRAKLDRAGRHLGAFKAAAAEITARAPELIPGEFDAGRGRYLFRAPRDMQASLELSAIAGDVVHNLFATLDYLAWELTPAAERVGREQRISFPIRLDNREYESIVTDRLKGVDQNALNYIRQLQPFSADPQNLNPSEHPLARLWALEIQDKHRALNILDVEAIGELIGLGPSFVHRPGPVPFLRGSYRQGDVLASFGPFEADSQPGIALQITHGLTFGEGPCEGHGAVEILDRIAGYVSGSVVLPLSRFL